jgi:tetratricopeptide (TPR) repeat protein
MIVGPQILLQLGRWDEGLRAFGRAEAIFRALLAVDSDNPERRHDLAACYAAMGFYGQDSPAKALALYEALARRFPEDTRYQRGLAGSHLLRGIVCWGEDSDLPRANRHLEEAVRILVRLLAAAPANPELQNALGHALRDQANAHRDLGSESDAESRYRLALDLHEKLASRHPTRPQYATNLAWDLWELGRLLIRTGRAGEAAPLSDRAAALFEGLSSDYAEASAFREFSARALAECAAVRLRTGRRAEAEPLIRELEGLTDRRLAAECLNQVAWYLVRDVGLGPAEPGLAAKLARRALSYRPDSIDASYTLGLALYRAGEWDAAVEALGHATGRNRGNGYRLNKGFAYPGFVLATAHEKRGDCELARSWYDRSVAWLTEHSRRDPVLLRDGAEAAALLGVKPPGGEARPESTP